MFQSNVTAGTLLAAVLIHSSPTNLDVSGAAFHGQVVNDQLMKKAGVSLVSNVLVQSPRGVNRLDSGMSLRLKTGLTYRIRVEFKDKNGDTFKPDKFHVRKVFLYQWSGNNEQDCGRNMCWSNLRQFTSLGTLQQEDIKVPMDTKWLVSSWHTGFPQGMTMQVDYADCVPLNCWSVEEVSEDGRPALRFVVRYEPLETKPRGGGENLKASLPGTTIITILPLVQ
jgi:hypothetical protein